MKPIQSLAPRVCPNCHQENTFAVLENRIECRHCGYVLRKPDGQRLTPADETPTPGGPRGGAPLQTTALKPAYQPDQPLRPSYRITHIGEVDKWARAAFDTGQDYVRRENWEEAAKAFMRSVDYQPDFVDAHLWLSRIVTDPVVKRDHLTTVLANQPNHLEAIRELMILDGKLSPQAAKMSEFDEPERRAAGGAVGTQTHNLRCPQCGSNQMAADDLTGLIVCQSCGFSRERPRGGVNEGMLTMALLERRAQPVQWIIGERLLACNSCGAARTIPARKLSDRCPFCGSNHVIERDVLGSFQQPDGLIPFLIDRKQAGDRVQERLGGWAERIKGWFDSNKVERATLEGLYVPYWVFDSMLEVRRTTIRHGSDGRDNRRAVPDDLYRTETIPEMLNNVQVCAVKSPPPLLTRKLGSFDMSKTIPYEASLLASYPAELYSIDFDKASLQAREMISQTMRAKHSITVTSGTQVNISSSVTQMTFQLILMPVWVATLYEEDGDIRAALVNGQTGQVALGKAQKSR